MFWKKRKRKKLKKIFKISEKLWKNMFIFSYNKEIIKCNYKNKNKIIAIIIIIIIIIDNRIYIYI